jgi:hypothetical protein
MLPRLKIPGWLSSVKTVALKRENTQKTENIKHCTNAMALAEDGNWNHIIV